MQQTYFESEHALENAEVMLDVCREEYESAGRLADVQALRGLDVKSPASAEIALLTVQNLPDTAEVHDVRRYTIEALQSACRLMKTSNTKLAS